MPNHVAVWIDHREARVFVVATDHVEAQTIRLAQHLHRKNAQLAAGAREHPEDEKKFFHELCRALEGSAQILVVGPSTAKLDFVRYLHRHEASLEPRIVGVETVDHPTDGQLVAYAKKYFGLPVRIAGK
jgi:stalled ribosome rescue protein Dom34